MTTAANIQAFLEDWAPAATAQEYDNVGLQIGRGDRTVHRIIVALDLVPAVIDEAEQTGADLILTHHPLIFRPLYELAGGTTVSSMALRLAEAQIGLIAAHTNLDAARGGVSFVLAEALGLTEVMFLEPLPGRLTKVVVFVPTASTDVVRSAMARAGAGRIGQYDECSFAAPGTGTFFGRPDTNPAIGQAGQLERVEETRVEMQVDGFRLGAVLAAMRDTHPYEQVAYDLYPLDNVSSETGMGAIGRLRTPISLAELLDHTSEVLGCRALRYSGDPDRPVQTVAVCGGSGASLLPAARRGQADALITADISYHRFFDAMDDQGRFDLALVDAGHYETEQLIEQRLAERLVLAFPTVAVSRTTHRTNPVRVHIRST